MKIYAFLADGMEEVELLAVTDCLQRAKVETVLVSVMGRKEVVSSHNVTIVADEQIEDVDVADADLLFLPGGMPGTTNLSNCALLIEMLKKHAAAGKRIAAICAAPSVLGMNGLLEGRHATCYPGFEEKLLGAKALPDAVVMDGNIITSRGMGTAISFGAALVSVLAGEETAEELLKSIQY